MDSVSEEIKNQILSKLEEIATPKKKERELAFFKFRVTNILGTGIKPMRGVIDKMMPALKIASDKDVMAAAISLIETEIYEAQLAGIEIFYQCKDRLDLNQLFNIGSSMIENGLLNNWSTVDNISKYVFGYSIMANPELEKTTYRWTKSDNIWMRRASLVTYIIPARERRSMYTIFRTAKKLMRDNNEYVLKAIGWLLRETSILDKRRVENFIYKYGLEMPRITIRSAIENFPKEERDFLMEQTKGANYLEERYSEILKARAEQEASYNDNDTQESGEEGPYLEEGSHIEEDRDGR